jgi:hypothetical protein
LKFKAFTTLTINGLDFRISISFWMFRIRSPRTNWFKRWSLLLAGRFLIFDLQASGRSINGWWRIAGKSRLPAALMPIERMNRGRKRMYLKNISFIPSDASSFLLFNWCSSTVFVVGTFGNFYLKMLYSIPAVVIMVKANEILWATIDCSFNRNLDFLGSTITTSFCIR